MHPIRRPRVKICCIAGIEEAQLAIACGASAIGLVSEMPSGPGPIPEERIAVIARTIPPGVASFLLTCRQDTGSIVDQQRRVRTNTLQLVDTVSIDTYRELRAALPGIAIVQVVHVTGDSAIQIASRFASHVDAILLDSGNPQLAVKQLGGTGRRHDWTISRRIREAVNIPIFLAGGLNAGNVREAIETVGPFALDVCSGVRTNGKLDKRKLSEFMEAAHDVRSNWTGTS